MLSGGQGYRGVRRARCSRYALYCARQQFALHACGMCYTKSHAVQHVAQFALCSRGHNHSRGSALPAVPPPPNPAFTLTPPPTICFFSQEIEFVDENGAIALLTSPTPVARTCGGALLYTIDRPLRPALAGPAGPAGPAMPAAVLPGPAAEAAARLAAAPGPEGEPPCQRSVADLLRCVGVGVGGRAGALGVAFWLPIPGTTVQDPVQVLLSLQLDVAV